MQKLSLTLARFLLAGWVGAAVLFVITSVAEQTSDELDSTVKSTLALIRFPWYYLFGFALMSLGLVFGVLGTRLKTVGMPRRITFIVLLVLGLMTMTGDYFFIYGPLARMTRKATEEVEARPQQFVDYHEYSKNVNTVVLGLSAVAALLVCWPTWEPEPHDDRW